MIATKIPAEWIGRRVIVTREGCKGGYGNGSLIATLRGVNLEDPEWHALDLGDMPDGSSGPFSAHQSVITVTLAPEMCARHDERGNVVRQSCGSPECVECGGA